MEFICEDCGHIFEIQLDDEYEFEMEDWFELEILCDFCSSPDIRENKKVDFF